MDAGTRSVSLKALARLAEVLACSPADLLEAKRGSEAPVFRHARVNAHLQERDLGTPDGIEKEWVHAAQLAWRRHYRTADRRG